MTPWRWGTRILVQPRPLETQFANAFHRRHLSRAQNGDQTGIPCLWCVTTKIVLRPRFRLYTLAAAFVLAHGPFAPQNKNAPTCLRDAPSRSPFQMHYCSRFLLDRHTHLKSETFSAHTQSVGISPRLGCFHQQCQHSDVVILKPKTHAPL